MKSSRIKIRQKKRVRGMFNCVVSIFLLSHMCHVFFFYIPIMPDMPLLAYAMGLMSGWGTASNLTYSGS